MYHNCRCQHSAFFFFFQTNFSVFASLGPEHNQAIMYHSTEWKYEPSISSRESAITHCVKSKMPLHSSGVDLCKRCRVLYTYMHVYIVRHSQVTESYPLMTCHFFLCSGWFANESFGLVIVSQLDWLLMIITCQCVHLKPMYQQLPALCTAEQDSEYLRCIGLKFLTIVLIHL